MRRERHRVIRFASTFITGGSLSICALAAMAASPAATSTQSVAVGVEQPPQYEVEWVYRIKWGYEDEFWRIFQKTQIPVLDRQKELGYIVSYRVYHPGLHTSEDSRWNYRVVITYKDIVSSTKEAAVTAQLFPDRAAYSKEEHRRWELVEAHYDLPIREIDPHASE